MIFTQKLFTQLEVSVRSHRTILYMHLHRMIRLNFLKHPLEHQGTLKILSIGAAKYNLRPL